MSDEDTPPRSRRGDILERVREVDPYAEPLALPRPRPILDAVAVTIPTEPPVVDGPVIKVDGWPAIKRMLAFILAELDQDIPSICAFTIYVGPDQSGRVAWVIPPPGADVDESDLPGPPPRPPRDDTGDDEGGQTF